MATTSCACPMATNHGVSPMTTNSRDSSPQWAGAFGASNTAKPAPVVPTLREAEVARNTLDVDVGRKLLGEWAGGDSVPIVPLPNVPLHNVPLPNVPLPSVPLPNVPLPNVTLPEESLPYASPDGLVQEN